MRKILPEEKTSSANALELMSISHGFYIAIRPLLFGVSRAEAEKARRKVMDNV